MCISEQIAELIRLTKTACRPSAGRKEKMKPYLSGCGVIARIQWTNEDEMNECIIDEMIRASMLSALA